jgi:hypothetical protein
MHPELHQIAARQTDTTCFPISSCKHHMELGKLKVFSEKAQAYVDARSINVYATAACCRAAQQCASLFRLQ